MPGWTDYRDLVRREFDQSKEEGRDPGAVEALRAPWESAGNDAEKLRAVWRQILAVPIRSDFPYVEPGDLPGIRAQRPAPVVVPALRLSDAELYDRLHGAWLARCCGCALGKPVEVFMEAHQGLTSQQRIKEYLRGIGEHEWPLNFYFPGSSPASDRTGKLGWPESTREKIAFMEVDDDLCYTVIGQIVLQSHGRDFTTEHVAQTWLANLPYRAVCTAETQAYRNLVQAYEWHHAKHRPVIDWDWVANHENPYREWIGADIRADSYGYGAPGDPELAAEFAWRDARMTHVKNGVYGSMFMAAMIAAAFVTDDPRLIIQAGLAQIPQRCRLAVEMQQVIAICDEYQCRYSNFEKVLERIVALLGHYSAVHTNNNAAVVVMALLLGERNFEKTITLAVMGGWDTDCNGATAGSILGAMLGAKKLPARWTDPLHDTLHTAIPNYAPIAISECARRSAAIAKTTRVG